jgi:hypothetical protein
MEKVEGARVEEALLRGLCKVEDEVDMGRLGGLNLLFLVR